MPAVLAEIGPEHVDALREHVESVAEGLEAELPPGRRQLALGLVALMVGGLSLARALRGTTLSDEVLKACRALGVFAARGK